MRVIAKKVYVRIAEVTLFALAIGGLNLFFPDHPGFSHLELNPFVFMCLLVAAYYGRYAGFYAFAASILVAVFAVPAAVRLAGLVHPQAAQPLPFSSTDAMLAIVTFLMIFVIGLIRDRFYATVRSLCDRARAGIRAKVKQQNLSGALFTVNRELEERVSRQVDTLSMLFTQVHKLYSSNLPRMLDGILETVERVSGATDCSIWEYRHDERKLLIAAQRGGENVDEIATSLPADHSIEGWVVRNNATFSVQLLAQYANLQELDGGRNILTFPVAAGRRVWGALTIGAMPFGKFNRHTQRLIEMILALVSPSLDRATEYEMTLAQAEVDMHTGLPLISQFYTLLEGELYRVRLQNGTLSVVILEVVNADEIREQHGQEGYYQILNRMIDELQRLSDNQADIFRYRTDNQLAVLYPSLDFDGASLFCLELLTAVSTTPWEVNGTAVSVDAIVGYSALDEKRQTSTELLRGAEQLLEMQKV